MTDTTPSFEEITERIRRNSELTLEQVAEMIRRHRATESDWDTRLLRAKMAVSHYVTKWLEDREHDDRDHLAISLAYLLADAMTLQCDVDNGEEREPSEDDIARIQPGLSEALDWLENEWSKEEARS